MLNYFWLREVRLNSRNQTCTHQSNILIFVRDTYGFEFDCFPSSRLFLNRELENQLSPNISAKAGVKKSCIGNFQKYICATVHDMKYD